MFESLTSLLISQPSTLFVVALAGLVMLSVLLIPCVLAAPDADHGHTAAAIVMYLLQFFGLTLVFAGISPMILLLESRVLPDIGIMQIPIVLLAIGMWLLVHYGHEVKKLDATARALPHALYMTIVHVVGILLLILSIFTAAASMLVDNSLGQWDGYLLTAGIGILLIILFPLPQSVRRKSGLMSKVRKK